MNRYLNKEQYFRELSTTSRSYYLDYIRKFKKFDKSSRILEIGCGEGGNLLPFAELGCYVCGVDISESKISNAKLFFGKKEVHGDFFCDDFLKIRPASDAGSFDIILIHDVIEHIEPGFKEDFFSNVKMFIKKDGIVFWGFPAWQMPFGGHQQTCKSRICSKVPFVHLFPQSIYRTYLRIFGEESSQIDELMSIKRSKMTVESFERLCGKTGYNIVDRTLWFINPHYEVKFHLHPVKLCGFFCHIPYLRNYMSTACFYITALN
jgi:SAM-dependent methyltransferase